MVARVLYSHCASWQGILQQAQHLKAKAFIRIVFLTKILYIINTLMDTLIIDAAATQATLGRHSNKTITKI